MGNVSWTISSLNTALGAFSALATLIAALLLVRTESLRARLKKLQELCDGITFTKFEDTSVFILGPRTAGKTSVVTAWIHIWKEVMKVSATPVDFVEHRYQFAGASYEAVFDNSVGINIGKRTHARAIIYDYAGEDAALPSALEKISQAKQYVIIFVLTCEPEKERLNAEYFNTNFLKRMQNALGKAEQPTLASFVLFNKHDLLSNEVRLDDDSALVHSKTRNEVALGNIRAVFGQPKTFLVSAETGFGISPFLRALSACMVDAEGAPKNA